MVLKVVQDLNTANEITWFHLGQVAESLNEPERAIWCYDAALRYNPQSEKTLMAIATAAEYFQRILKANDKNGQIWGALGHCYLMMDELQHAYSAYQQAVHYLPNTKEPKLWYGIGILYDRFGSLEHAEEAFSAVLRMNPDFDRANEIFFRLGGIYKNQGRYDRALECFRSALRKPPSPMTEADILFQIGMVYDRMQEFQHAAETYDRVLYQNPSHPKALQQLGWLLQRAPFGNLDMAASTLIRSVEADPADAFTYYLLGRSYMMQKKYTEAYEAYQNAVYRDGRNPVFWCSIGILYYQINQPSDALDAYSRAIRINSYIPEVWYNLGALYESCNNQIKDAMDAYSRAAELEPNNVQITTKLKALASGQPSSDLSPLEVANPEKYAPKPSNQSGNSNNVSAAGNVPAQNGVNSANPTAYGAINASGLGSGGSSASSHGRHGPIPMSLGRPPVPPGDEYANIQMAGRGPEMIPGKDKDGLEHGAHNKKRHHVGGPYMVDDIETKRPKQV